MQDVPSQLSQSNYQCVKAVARLEQVDNSVLRSSSSGVIYRSSPELGAIRAGSPVARFGSFVEGRILSKKWLKAEGGYLPLRIRGAPILELQAGLKKLMNEKNIKQCPSCRQGIEKRRGCDHMTCKCGAQFCYICGADYLGPSGIFAVGNHVHAESCRHYRPFPWCVHWSIGPLMSNAKDALTKCYLENFRELN